MSLTIINVIMNCILSQLLVIFFIIVILITIIFLRDNKKFIWTCTFDNKTGIKLCE